MITPSMRRPEIVKNGFSFSPNLLVERTASAAILLSALFGSDASLGASWASSFQPALPPVYRPSFDLADRSGPGVIRSHRDSAVPLSNRDLIYITFPTAVLLFVSAGLLSLLRFERVDNLGAYRIPLEPGLLIPSVYNS